MEAYSDELQPVNPESDELGDLFENCNNMTSIRTALADMDHQQPPTLVAMYNTAANKIINGMTKQNKY